MSEVDSQSPDRAKKRLSPQETLWRLQNATLMEYDHGGGRLYFAESDHGRDLIADFYGEGHYRDFIMSLIRDADARTYIAAALHKRADWLRSEYLDGGNFEHLNAREQECRYLAAQIEERRI